jgi:pimeloyl-ACP methyl ester carboxylesterase
VTLARRALRTEGECALLLIVVALLVGGCQTATKTDLMPSGMAAVSGTRLYYEVRGQGQPVVLIHGGNLDCRMWEDQLQPFAERFKVVRYDVRGFGKSDRPTEPYSDVDDLYNLLDHLGIETAHVVGVSMGGTIAIDFALRHPERLDRLVVVGSGLSGYKWPADCNLRQWSIIEAARDLGPSVAVERWLQGPGNAAAMEDVQLAARLQRMATANAHAFLANPLLPRPIKPPAVERLDEIASPMLIVVGERDEPAIHAIADLLAEQVPGAQKAIIPAAGRWPNMEQPAEFNRLVLDFLARQ